MRAHAQGAPHHLAGRRQGWLVTEHAVAPFQREAGRGQLAGHQPQRFIASADAQLDEASGQPRAGVIAMLGRGRAQDRPHADEGASLDLVAPPFDAFAVSGRHLQIQGLGSVQAQPAAAASDRDRSKKTGVGAEVDHRATPRTGGQLHRCGPSDPGLPSARLLRKVLGSPARRRGSILAIGNRCIEMGDARTGHARAQLRGKHPGDQCAPAVAVERRLGVRLWTDDGRNPAVTGTGFARPIDRLAIDQSPDGSEVMEPQRAARCHAATRQRRHLPACDAGGDEVAQKPLADTQETRSGTRTVERLVVAAVLDDRQQQVSSGSQVQINAIRAPARGQAWFGAGRDLGAIDQKAVAPIRADP